MTSTTAVSYDPYDIAVNADPDEPARHRPPAVALIGDAAPIARTAQVASLPRLIARRELDPLLFDLNGAGAINGHIPITA